MGGGSKTKIFQIATSAEREESVKVHADLKRPKGRLNETLNREFKTIID